MRIYFPIINNLHIQKTTKPRKFRLLLDAAFAHSGKFIKLNKKAKLIHAVIDLGLSRTAEDKDIYQKACEENCFVLTINFDDFKKLVRPGKAGIIGIHSQLFNQQIDEIVADFISGKNPEDYLGKAVKI